MLGVLALLLAIPGQPPADSELGLPSPAVLMELAALDLATVPANKRFGTRYLTRWPYTEEDQERLESALLFWLASLNNRRPNPPLIRVNGGDLYRIYVPDYGWPLEAWEALVAADPYWAVSTIDEKDKSEIKRGWIDPVVEAGFRRETDSTLGIVRADFFMARTAIEIGHPEYDGFYSKFKAFPDTEVLLFKMIGIDEKFLYANLLLRGGAVLQSIVARHNRELQLFPTVWGSDERFMWRSLDTDDDLGKKSVLRNFVGTVRTAGHEYIGTNLNGTHWYYLTNAQKKQVDEVPTRIAQDKLDPHDSIVYSPWKCVSCHGRRSGIRHFDDVITRMALDKNVGLAVIFGEKTATRLRPPDDATKRKLEAYYLSDLGKTITRHQEAYSAVIRGINGLSAEENAETFTYFMHNYFYANVSKQQAAIETGIAIPLADQYFKASGNEDLLALVAGGVISRKSFEAAYADAMRAKIYNWERSPVDAIEHPSNKPPPTHPGADRQDGLQAAPVDPDIPAGAERLPNRSDDPEGVVRWRLGGRYYVRVGDRTYSRDPDGEWEELRGGLLQSKNRSSTRSPSG